MISGDLFQLFPKLSFARGGALRLMGSHPSGAKRFSIAGMDDRFFACVYNACLFAAAVILVL